MRKMKKGLAVLLAVLLLLPSISVMAEETVSTVPEEGTAAVEELSGGDVSENDVSGEEEMADEESTEEEAAESGDATEELGGETTEPKEETTELREVTAEQEEVAAGYALDGAAYAGTSSGSLTGGFTWTCDGETVTISGSGTGTDQTWKDLREVVWDYDNGIFSDLYAVRKIAFSNCSITGSMKKAFFYNTILDTLEQVEINFSGLDTSGVTDMSEMFACGSNIISALDVSSFDTSNVTDMSEMFAGCSNLTSLDLSNFDTSNVTNMEWMFARCSNLTSLDVSSFNTSNVTNMWGMFSEDSSLKEVKLTNFDTSKVTDICGMFYGCESLEELDLSSFSLPLYNIWNYTFDMFINCNSLKVLKTPQAIGTSGKCALPDVYYDIGAYERNGELREVTFLDSSCVGTTLRKCGEVPDAVKYVIYSEMLPGAVSGQSYSVTLGNLPSGMELKANGELCGIPMEAGSFIFGTSENTYVLTVIDNTDVNAESRTDSGYEIIQRIPNFTTDSITTNTIVSNGAYSEFTDVYIDGQKLVKDTDYTSEDGSTRVTIYAQTFSRFNQVGVHTITMEFRKTDASGGSELKRAVQNYYISAPGSNSEDSGGNSSSGGTSSESTGGSGSSSGSSSSSKNGSITTDESSTPEAEFIYYTVQPGDTLWKISEKFYGSGELWERIYLANTDVIQNPNRIYVGQILKIYLSPDGSTITVPNGNANGNGSVIYYTVASGDTLWGIAKKYYGNGRLWRRIYEANTSVISDSERLYAGWLIAVPSI